MSALEAVFAGLDTPPVVPPHERQHKVTEAEPARLYELHTPAQLAQFPPMRWLVHGVLPAEGVASIYGPSTSGKSFLALDLAANLAEAETWFGHRIKKRGCRVVIVVMEGAAGFRLRVKAWEARHGCSFPEAVRFVFDSFKLIDRADVLRLACSIEAAGGADAVLIDTLNRAAPCIDENSARDMGQVLEGSKELQGMFGGLLILVAHTGKDAQKGLRGHSSLFAALDAVIEVARTDDRREWRSDKVKDGKDGEAVPFRLEVVDLGEDEEGDPITSCVVSNDDAPTTNRPRPPKGGNQRIVYDALGPLLRDSTHFGKAGAPAQRPCLELEAAVLQVKDRLTVEPKRRAERARQAINGMVASGVMGHNEGWVWLR
jgi:putative DNA primase/helicase